MPPKRSRPEIKNPCFPRLAEIGDHQHHHPRTFIAKNERPSSHNSTRQPSQTSYQSSYFSAQCLASLLRSAKTSARQLPSALELLPRISRPFPPTNISHHSL